MNADAPDSDKPNDAWLQHPGKHILELDGTGGSHRHRGGYAAYLEGREQRWAAEAQAANSGTAWQSVLAAMTGQSAAAEHDSVRWQTLLDRLALGSRWTPPSALLRPHLVDTDGVPIAFIETARPAGYAMRLATGAVPFGHDDRALPSIAELTHALAGKLRPQRS